MTKRAEIIDNAIKILEGRPDGIRYSDLKREIINILPSMNPNTIDGIIWKLDKITKGLVVKPDRGFFLLKKYQGIKNHGYGSTSIQMNIKGTDELAQPLKEEDFYPKFAEYLKKIHECTKTVPYGSNRQGKKWENPDVIGWYTELTFGNQQYVLVSGELKISTKWEDIVTGFGQAASYLLFSHKSYYAIPKQTNQDEKRKVESLCVILGIGLLYFDNTNKDDPKFEVGNRAIRREPDIYFLTKRANEFKEVLES